MLVQDGGTLSALLRNCARHVKQDELSDSDLKEVLGQLQVYATTAVIKQNGHVHGNSDASQREIKNLFECSQNTNQINKFMTELGLDKGKCRSLSSQLETPVMNGKGGEQKLTIEALKFQLESANDRIESLLEEIEEIKAGKMRENFTLTEKFRNKIEKIEEEYTPHRWLVSFLNTIFVTRPIFSKNFNLDSYSYFKESILRLVNQVQESCSISRTIKLGITHGVIDKKDKTVTLLQEQQDHSKNPEKQSFHNSSKILGQEIKPHFNLLDNSEPLYLPCTQIEPRKKAAILEPNQYYPTSNDKVTRQPHKDPESINISPQSTKPSFTLKEFEELWTHAERRLGFDSTEEIEAAPLFRNANSHFRSLKRNNNTDINDLGESSQPIEKNNKHSMLEDNAYHSTLTSSVHQSLCSVKKRKHKDLESYSLFSMEANGSSSYPMLTNDNVQTRAMYGRTLFSGVEKIMEMTDLTSSDIFLDIGHGIGNAAMQTSLTLGCESRGIEVVSQRCMIADSFQKIIMEQLHESFCAEDSPKHANLLKSVGNLELRNGSLTDPKHREFMVQADVVLVNNAHDIFGVRSGDVAGRPTVDAHVAGIFAQLKPGAMMVTFFPLLALGSSLFEENDRRWKNGLRSSVDASFFTMERKILGENVVSWTTNEVIVYLYTRVVQNSSDGSSLFLCGNQKCSFGNSHGTLAVDEKTGLLKEDCVYCGAKRIVKTRELCLM